MQRVRIKICGITTVELARHCCQQGVDYIGLVFAPRSIRYLNNIAIASEIAHIAHRCNVIPVAVFTEHDSQSIINICGKTGITTVQLHGKRSRDVHHLLPKHFYKIYAINADTQGKHRVPPLHTLNSASDKLLFDGTQPGSGNFFNHSASGHASSFDYFIAGGLSVDNLAKSLASNRPYGVDISSGVEITPGIKDPTLISEFIRQVRYYD